MRSLSASTLVLMSALCSLSPVFAEEGSNHETEQILKNLRARSAEFRKVDISWVSLTTTNFDFTIDGSIVEDLDPADRTKREFCRLRLLDEHCVLLDLRKWTWYEKLERFKLDRVQLFETVGYRVTHQSGSSSEPPSLNRGTRDKFMYEGRMSPLGLSYWHPSSGRNLKQFEEIIRAGGEEDTIDGITCLKFTGKNEAGAAVELYLSREKQRLGLPLRMRKSSRDGATTRDVRLIYGRVEPTAEATRLIGWKLERYYGSGKFYDGTEAIVTDWRTLEADRCDDLEPKPAVGTMVWDYRSRDDEKVYVVGEDGAKQVVPKGQYSKVMEELREKWRSGELPGKEDVPSPRIDG
ncbi:hypothetical protein [Stratiformator vulcanicus]|uniref:Uncharacterized protein n=1 Tax=Stratiformator vulcanicus TaxID=2527980 RepID=A0A517R094_9PLAN|nr:hypothetical protein [Stratiformator vulcanicus]QDT37240.1 hypothetical protein Pan189_16130 [Stratiformator vulcanicus]